jgi:hypothetical protein
MPTVSTKTNQAVEAPLSAIAARLGWTYNKAFNAVLSGQIKGRRLENGRWLVDVASVSDLERSLAAASHGRAA